MAQGNVSLSELYSEIAHDEAAVESAIARALPPPRPPGLLVDKLLALGVTRDDVVLDLGCGRGDYARSIAAARGCRVIGLDLMPRQVAAAHANAPAAVRVRFACATAEALPLATASLDYVWCRDMLYHVELGPTLEECARTLRSGGHLITYQSFATERLEPAERRLLTGTNPPDSMDASFFERRAIEAGFVILERDVIGSEWRELWESEDSRTSQKLLRAARLLRGAEALRRELGQVAYDIHLADCLWGVYQMIGKLEPTAYVLRRL